MGSTASLHWVRCAEGQPPRSSQPSDELDPRTYAVLADALMVKQTFTPEEMAALGIDRAPIRTSSYIKVGERGECYAPVSAFDSLCARLSALCQALDVSLHDSRSEATYGRFDDDDEVPIIDNG